MTSLNELVRSQQDHATTGGQFIGSLVWWSLNGNRVSHSHLKELADQYGLPDHYLPAEVRPASAFRRAWRHASTKLPQGLLLRQIDETSSGIHIGLVQEKADALAQELNYEHVLTVAFSKEHHTIQANDPSHLTVRQIEHLYAHHQELTTRDIRAMLGMFVSEAGVSLRESGGVYFIAAPHQPIIEAMAEVLQAIGHNHLHQLPLYDSPLAQDVLNGVAVTSLDDEIQRLQEELEVFMADDKTRKSTLKKRLDVFDALRSRVSTFAGVLSFKADDLLDQVSLMEQELRCHLGMDVADPPCKIGPQPPSLDTQSAQPSSLLASMPALDAPQETATNESPYIFDPEAGF